MTLELERGKTPDQTGTYVVYVREPNIPVVDIKVLMFYQGLWFYRWSDQRYRGNIVGWIGPLPPAGDMA